MPSSILLIISSNIYPCANPSHPEALLVLHSLLRPDTSFRFKHKYVLLDLIFLIVMLFSNHMITYSFIIYTLVYIIFNIENGI